MEFDLVIGLSNAPTTDGQGDTDSLDTFGSNGCKQTIIESANAKWHLGPSQYGLKSPMLHMRLLSPPSDPKAWMMIQPRGQQRWATFSALAMIIMMTTTTTTLLTRAEDLVEEKHTAYVTGDIILGGLFPMHEHNITKKEKPCGAIKEEKGIQNLYLIIGKFYLPRGKRIVA
ncbi:hypothetical protein TCAL_17266 [Tigriopus californicus]|uniref:Uncharacterized protein n=1 Tax=Tigriopus californicus TaxID=6832 RepID=A0A553NZG8_TIGCA|nr:hypothetical protein TCAL_17266 [Tigriopus californicus]